MLLAAGTVPDHGKLRPFRFAVVEGEGRAAFGTALAEAAAERKPSMSPEAKEGVRAKAFRSPTIIALIASPKPGKIEVWEQHASAAAAGYAIVLAAHALGVGAAWKSVPFTRGAALTTLLGLADQEEMLGFIHLGTPKQDDKVPAPRDKLDIAAVTLHVDGTGVHPFKR